MFLSLVVFLNLFIKHKIFAFIFIAIYAVLMYKAYKHIAFYFILSVCFLSILALTLPLNANNFSYEGVVEEIKSSYVIVKDGRKKFLVYTKEVLNYNDTIAFSGEFIEIESLNRKSAYNFQKAMLKQGITHSIKPSHISVLKKGNTIKSKLYTQLLSHPDALYLKKVIFNINDYHEESKSYNLILSSGIMIRFLLLILMKFMHKIFDEKQSENIELFILCLLMIGFKTNKLFVYLFVYKFSLRLKLERFDTVFLAGIIMCFITPYYIFSLSFIVTTLYRVLSLVQVDKNKFIMSWLVMIPLQLILSFRVNLINIFMFPYTRIVSLIGFILALFDVLWFTQSSKAFMSIFLLDFKFLTITGHPSFLWLFLWSCVSLKILQKFTYLKIVMLLTLMIVNQNQLLLNPFFVYTQIYINQGDAALIKMPFKNEVMMIDTGSSYQEHSLKGYLDYYGVRSIQNLIITHDDEDHSGNQDFILEHYNVKNVISKAGTYYFYNLELKVRSYEEENDNDASLITSFSVNKYHYLSLGDVSKAIEKRYLNDYPNDYHIIKLAHHGSNTSSSDTLLESSSIKFLVNSSGINNMYQHPSLEVLQRISKHNQILLDTQVLGDIDIIHFLNFNFINT